MWTPNQSPFRFSSYLADCIKQYEELLSEEEGWLDEHKAHLQRIRGFCESLEEFSARPVASGPGPEPQPDPLLERLERFLWQWQADEFYGREVVLNLPAMARRFSRLRPVVVGRLPNRKEVRIYLREATRCFIFGFFQASIALSRAALEAGMNDYLDRRLGNLSHRELREKIDKGAEFKLISAEAASMAQRVRKCAQQVLHRKPATESAALESLSEARHVLKELYQE